LWEGASSQKLQAVVAIKRPHDSHSVLHNDDDDDGDDGDDSAGKEKGTSVV